MMVRLRRFLPEPIVMIGLALAFICFGFTFRGPRSRFWQRMTWTGLTLGSLSLIAEPKLRRTRFGPRDVALGLGSAGILYVIFQIGDRLTRLILPQGDVEIGAIYGSDKLRPRQGLAARLA